MAEKDHENPFTDVLNSGATGAGHPEPATEPDAPSSPDLTERVADLELRVRILEKIALKWHGSELADLLRDAKRDAA